MKNIVDLHVHTSCSDGSYSPSQIVDLAIKEHIKAVAITDHDSISGVEEALRYGEEKGSEVVPGVEISVDSALGSFHILGYYIDHTEASLNRQLDEIRDFRDNRNPKIIDKLNELGMEISMQEVSEEAGRGVVGRPHMARVMLRKKYVSSIQEAFDKYLKAGAAAYINKKRVSQEQGIAMIRASSGIAVWAHPGVSTWESDDQLKTTLEGMVEQGLQGIEAYYSEYTPEQTHSLCTLAREYGLLITGGTDFHGKTKPEIKLGRGKGDMEVSYRFLEELKRRRAY